MKLETVQPKLYQYYKLHYILFLFIEFSTTQEFTLSSIFKKRQFFADSQELCVQNITEIKSFTSA